jgi:hypothetical protein
VSGHVAATRTRRHTIPPDHGQRGCFSKAGPGAVRLNREDRSTGLAVRPSANPVARIRTEEVRP